MKNMHSTPTKLNISDELRARLSKSNLENITAIERTHIEDVYTAITGKVLSKGCKGSCIPNAFKIINNWMARFEIVIKKEIPTIEMTGDAEITGFKFTDKPIEGMEFLAFNKNKEVNLEDYSLKQLRLQYPKIKSTSKEGFIKKVKAIVDAAISIKIDHEPKAVMIIECKDQIIMDGFEAQTVPEGVERILVLNPDLDESEKVIQLPSLYTQEDITKLRNELNK
jgi:hypothetical protein